MILIKKGFAFKIAICGFLHIILGLLSSICGWILSSNLPNGFSFEGGGLNIKTSYEFQIYWWGGCHIIVAGIIGIVVGFRRNIYLALAFLVVNNIGLLVVVGFAAYFGFILWVMISSPLNKNSCVSQFQACTCFNGKTKLFKFNASCAVLTSNQPLIILSTVGAALSGCIAFVCSFISCFSLCNTEHVNTGFIIQQPSFIAVTPGSQYRQFFQTPDLFNQQLLYGGQAPVSFAETDNSNNNCYSTDRAPLIDNR
ncbi:uncharacterized protein LOC124808994 isoform X1 [Hydra vulgaris]|uniref:uncharacterized protein LOC124808994 isoform X1 n=1 Tax=Hydra vulgaris TaxID=6087 RepID=UPI001F5F1C1A|nr:uncharacterized protein LOC124808994 isoform X1 [Hydra vulgaris]